MPPKVDPGPSAKAHVDPGLCILQRRVALQFDPALEPEREGVVRRGGPQCCEARQKHQPRAGLIRWPSNSMLAFVPIKLIADDGYSRFTNLTKA
ncbi:hypothetical protein HK405_014504 [Cladochytrium tenue]|nr:hypothetical protein HK405_014504 [Cladochytrium tenue]